MSDPRRPRPMIPMVFPARLMPTGTPSWNRPARMFASAAGIARAAAKSKPSANSAVAAWLAAPPTVLHTSTPRAVQQAVSSEALRAPVMPSMRSLGKRLMREAGSGVRSRIDRMMSKSASFRSGIVFIFERLSKKDDFGARQ